MQRPPFPGMDQDKSKKALPGSPPPLTVGRDHALESGHQFPWEKPASLAVIQLDPEMSAEDSQDCGISECL